MRFPASRRPAAVGLPLIAGRGARHPRLAITALLIGLLAAASAGSLWMTTPSGEDLIARVAAIAASAHEAPLQAADVQPLMAQAMVAAEDERFFSHHGLDTVGIGRSVWDDATRWCLCEGGSTITQQLAKVIYFPDRNPAWRKLPGMILALRIEGRHSKAEILAAYLTVVSTGYGLVGARAASCAYFGHDIQTVSAAEAAEIAGMVQAPSWYDPRFHPDRAAARRAYVLDRMVAEGYLTPDQARQAALEPVVREGAGRC